MSNNHMAKCKNHFCFANYDGTCICLTNGRFEKGCPFCKTRDEIALEKKKTKERLDKLGLTKKVIKKYGGVLSEQGK